jgi:osmotically inducible protein OsmC
MPTRQATAVWEGGLREGKGSVAAATGTFSTGYSFPSRFGDGAAGHTSPEELIAAAHAGCLAMALGAALERAGTPAERVEATAACTVEKVDDAFRITRMALTVRGRVPGITEERFAQAAEGAKTGCPVSNALHPGIAVTLDARLA